MDNLEKREKEIFETIKRLKNYSFVIIGGYAVNAYTLPRFSTDCDIVVKDKSESKKIETELLEIGYVEEIESQADTQYYGEFKRYTKEIEGGFKVSIDILIRDVLDRQTDATFSANWIFENSKECVLRGKTISEELTLNIVNLDALFAMKAISCRKTDIRDIFMLVSGITRKEWVKQEIKSRYDLNDRLQKIEDKVNSAEFRDGLQSVFGKVPDKIFEKQKELIAKLKENNGAT